MPKWCDEGRSNVFQIYLKNESQNIYLYLGLYTDPTEEPGYDATLIDLVEPSDLTGYARIPLDPADWEISGVNPVLAAQPKKTFTADGGDWGNVYGYFITDAETGYEGKLIAVEQFDNGPYNILDTAAVDVTPKLTAPRVI